MQLKAGITALAERQLQRQTKTLKEKEKENICKFLSQDGTENAEAVKRKIGITRENAGTKKKKGKYVSF